MRFARDVLANVLGKVWTGLINFAFVPFYIKTLGIESFGLIGLFASLSAVLAVFDMGLAATLARELSHTFGSDALKLRAINLLRAFELIYWGVGLLFAGCLAAASPWIAEAWLNPLALPADGAVRALILMSLAIFFRWPSVLYTNALLGLQSHIRANLMIAATATIQSCAAAFCLSLVGPFPSVFFASQLAVAIVSVLVYRYVLWRAMPKLTHRPKLTMQEFNSVRVFIGGVSGIGICSLILMQGDKLILSSALSLESFGYYTFASSSAGVLTLASTAIYAAMLPTFSRLVFSKADSTAIADTYHKSCQILGVLVIPPFITLIAFSRELIELYTGSAQIAERSSALLSVLALGNLLLSVMILPLALQLAHGWTRLSFYKNVLAVLIFLPTLILATRRWGAMGAATCWLMVPASYLLIEIPIMHRRLLVKEMRVWYQKDIASFFLASVVVIGLARLALPTNVARLYSGIYIFAAYGSAMLASVLISRQVRDFLWALLTGRPTLPSHL